MTTELVELAERPEFTVDEALRIADQNADSYEKVASVSRTLAAEVRRLRALASRAGGWRTIESAPRTGIAVLLFQPWKSGRNCTVIGHYANGWYEGVAP